MGCVTLTLEGKVYVPKQRVDLEEVYLMFDAWVG